MTSGGFGCEWSKEDPNPNSIAAILTIEIWVELHTERIERHGNQVVLPSGEYEVQRLLCRTPFFLIFFFRRSSDQGCLPAAHMTGRVATLKGVNARRSAMPLRSIALVLLSSVVTAAAGADTTRLTIAGESALNGIFDRSASGDRECGCAQPGRALRNAYPEDVNRDAGADRRGGVRSARESETTHGAVEFRPGCKPQGRHRFRMKDTLSPQ